VSTRRALFIFFGLAYAWAWLVFVPMVVFRAPLEWSILATLGPAAAALLTHRVTTGSYRAFRIYGAWPRTLGATAIGVALIVFAYVVLPGVTTADPRELNWNILASLTVYHYSTVLAGPLGEEPGWRGYALPRLEASVGPVRASLVLGCVWATWHLPLFWYPGWTSAPLWIYVLILIGWSTIMTFVTNLAQFNVLPAIAMHAAFNTTPKYLAGLFANTQPSVSVPFELLLALCGLATAALLAAATRGRLAYHADPASAALAPNSWRVPGDQAESA
jgi:uncharacterized protein